MKRIMLITMYSTVYFRKKKIHKITNMFDAKENCMNVVFYISCSGKLSRKYCHTFLCIIALYFMYAKHVIHRNCRKMCFLFEKKKTFQHKLSINFLFFEKLFTDGEESIGRNCSAFYVHLIKFKFSFRFMRINWMKNEFSRFYHILYHRVTETILSVPHDITSRCKQGSFKI